MPLTWVLVGHVSFHTLRLQVFSLSQVTIGKLSIGHIINLTTNDVQRLEYVRMIIIGTLIDSCCPRICVCTPIKLLSSKLLFHMQYNTYCITAYLYIFFRHLSIHTFSGLLQYIWRSPSTWYT